jgi:hypothetical protein
MKLDWKSDMKWTEKIFNSITVDDQNSYHLNNLTIETVPMSIIQMINLNINVFDWDKKEVNFEDETIRFTNLLNHVSVTSCLKTKKPWNFSSRWYLLLSHMAIMQVFNTPYKDFANQNDLKQRK